MDSRFPYLTAAESRFGVVGRAAVLERREVIAHDGRPLAAFTAGPPDAPAVLLVNPLGSTCLFVVRLAEILARRCRVVTWETRGLPAWYPDDTAGAWAPEIHTRDLAAVLADAGVERVASVASYCSGSHVVLHAVAHDLLEPSRIALISPPVDVRADGQKTLYQKTMPPLLGRIARGGPRTVALLRALLRQGAQVLPGDPDHELHVLNNLPFTSDERTYRYACLHAAWHGTPWTQLAARIAIPTAIFHGADDEIVHADTVAALAAAMPRAHLQVYDRQGHFAVSTCEALIADVARFAMEPHHA